MKTRCPISNCLFSNISSFQYKKGKINSLSNYCPLDLFSG